MQQTKQIAIILADTLQSTGLQSILIDYFPPVEVAYYPSFSAFSAEENDFFDFYFTNTETFVLNSEFFLPRKNKTVILITGDMAESHSNHLSVHSPQEILIAQLRKLFATDHNGTHSVEAGRELSVREQDVLHLIVKGSTNKEIADKLNISLNTVLSHRKNITAKLGIKTVSGLTYYAIMNGFLSPDDIDI